MPHEVRYWPAGVYPGEVESECPEGMVDIDVLLGAMREHGPSPEGYQFKNLGQRMSGLWQINLKVGRGRQVRVLYAPYGNMIILFRIHRKSSTPEQKRAYELARDRKRDYERQREREERASARNRPSR